MEKITNTIQLVEAIRLLEIKQKEETYLLKVEFNILTNKFSPINLVRNTISHFIITTDIKKNILSTALSVVAGYASKKIIYSENKNLIKDMLANILKVGIKKLINKNTDLI